MSEIIRNRSMGLFIMAQARYLSLFESGEIVSREKAANEMLTSCTLCPNNCKVDRTKNTKGICNTGNKAQIASYSPHFGEESPLVGQAGSGAIFFSQCNLGCVFCQNHEISKGHDGVEVTSGQLAAIMLSLQKQGCHNINFVTPSHVVPMIIEAVIEAVPKGLSVPLVYNTSAYDNVHTLKLLDGIIDIYMPDFKFFNKKTSQMYTHASNYPHHAKKAIIEMQRQVGTLLINEKSIAKKGLLVRHLLMPDGLEECKKIIQFVREEISKDTYLNIMDQYRPCGDAPTFSPINRTIYKSEYDEVIKYAKEIGITRLDIKDWRFVAELFSK